MLDQAVHAPTWDSGEGAYRVGGRWNSKGVRAVYRSLDPATAILEVAVHKGFRALDAVAHIMTAAVVADVGDPCCLSGKRAPSQLAAPGHSQRRTASLRRRFASTAPFRGDSERGLAA
ncbi:RES family NAD+ phosphorylase [Rhizobium leguminosarum]|uniref:RES family NAD+ phosphorylase n=1 Tax=Rhizobium TaxID=379 RepID=UPI003D7C1844